MRFYRYVIHSPLEGECSILTDVHKSLRTSLDYTEKENFTSQKVFVQETFWESWTIGD